MVAELYLEGIQMDARREGCQCSRCEEARRTAAVCHDFPRVGQDLNATLIGERIASQFNSELWARVERFSQKGPDEAIVFWRSTFPAMEPPVRDAMIAAIAKVMKA